MKVQRRARGRAGHGSGRHRNGRRKDGAFSRKTWRAFTVAFGDARTHIRIGEVDVPCYVLSSGQRVITTLAAQRAIGLGNLSTRRFAEMVSAVPGEGGDGSRFLSSKRELVDHLRTPLAFVPLEGPPSMRGYDVAVLRSLCDLMLRAGPEFLQANPHIAHHCNGIYADIAQETSEEDWLVDMVDAATGFDVHNKRSELAKGLEPLVHPRILKWLDVFPMEYFTSFWNLQNVQPYGFATLDLIFSRLHMRELVDLAQTTPGETDARGSLSRAEDRLRQHVSGVVALMNASPDWATFSKLLDRAFPKPSVVTPIRSVSDLLT